MNPEDLNDDERKIDEAILASLVSGYLPCPVALKLSSRLGVEAKAVGEAANRLRIRITDCLLGCFKIEKSKHEDLADRRFDQEIVDAVERSLVDGRLPCATAHKIGRGLKVGLKEIGDAATKMNIKISHCQLGCFS